MAPRPFRVAPALNQAQAALPWRFWASGNSFYAAGRHLGHAVKISFHPHENWQLRIASVATRLISTIEVLPGWLHALSIQWVVPPGALRPSAEDDIEMLVQTSHGWKLGANLLVSSGQTGSEPPLPEGSGILPWAAALRDGRRVALNIVNTLLSEYERGDIAQILGRAPKVKSGRYAEYIEHRLGRQPGNVIIVVPLGPESFDHVQL